LSGATIVNSDLSGTGISAYGRLFLTEQILSDKGPFTLILHTHSGSTVPDNQIVFEIRKGEADTSVLKADADGNLSIAGRLHVGSLQKASHTLDVHGAARISGSMRVLDNTQFFADSGDFGGGSGVIGITDAVKVPVRDPEHGGYLYSHAGDLYWYSSSPDIVKLSGSGEFTNRQKGDYSAGGSRINVASQGLYSQIFAVQLDSVRDSDEFGAYFLQESGAKERGEAFIKTPFPVHRIENNPRGLYKFAISDSRSTGSKNVRLFVGWTDLPMAELLNSDDPQGRYMGLHYSANKSPARYQFIVQNGSSQQRQDTGVNVRPDLPVFFEIAAIDPAISPPWLRMTLYDHEMNILASTTFSKKLPKRKVDLHFAAGIRSIGTGIYGLKHYYGWGENRK